MPLPQAIQQQIDAADEIVHHLSQPTDVDTGAPPNDEPAPDNPQAAPAAPTPPQPAPAPAPQPDYEQRYRALQGKYDAEVPRLAHENRELRNAVAALQEQMQALTAARQEHTKPLITDADKEAFGGDLIDLVDRATEQKVGPLRSENDQLKRQLAQLTQNTQNVAQTVQVTAQQQFLLDMDNSLANWRTINTDPGFIAWLDTPDPVFGVPRRVGLNAACESRDAAGATNVFKAYMGTLPQQPQTPTKSPQDDLRSQVAPTRSRVAAAPAPDDMSKRYFKESEIGQIYNDMRRGQYTIAEQERLEEAVSRAVAEGRVLPGQ